MVEGGKKAVAVDDEKKRSKTLQCLRRLASSCLRCVSKCVSNATLQHLLQFISLLFRFPHTLATRKINY